MPFSQPLGVRLFRSFARPIFRFIFRLTCRVSLRGLDGVPPRGAYIIAVNHLARYDPPLLLAFWPYPAEVLGASDQLTIPVIGPIMRGYGTIPVHRGEFDRALVDKALAVLRSNRPFVIAPEGGRTHRPGMREAKPGIAYLAAKADVPIVPVGIIGTEALIDCWKSFRRPRLSLTVGEPFRLPPIPVTGTQRRAHLAENTKTIMRRIADLLPSEYRGVYG